MRTSARLRSTLVAPGAKADLLVWRADSLFMAPVRDPIKNIVYSAEAEDLRSVMIDGAWVMRDGVVLNVDERAVTANLQGAGERMWDRIGPGHWAQRPADDPAPQTFDAFRG